MTEPGYGDAGISFTVRNGDEVAQLGGPRQKLVNAFWDYRGDKPGDVFGDTVPGPHNSELRFVELGRGPVDGVRFVRADGSYDGGHCELTGVSMALNGDAILYFERSACGKSDEGWTEVRACTHEFHLELTRRRELSDMDPGILARMKARHPPDTPVTYFREQYQDELAALTGTDLTPKFVDALRGERADEDGVRRVICVLLALFRDGYGAELLTDERDATVERWFESNLTVEEVLGEDVGPARQRRSKERPFRPLAIERGGEAFTASGWASVAKHMSGTEVVEFELTAATDAFAIRVEPLGVQDVYFIE